MPDQAHFGPKYFLAYTLPDFESRILGRIPEDKQNDVDTLFMLMEQLQPLHLMQAGNLPPVPSAPMVFTRVRLLMQQKKSKVGQLQVTMIKTGLQ